MDWICGNGSGATMTCMRDKLPGETGGNYHHKKNDSFDRIKVARLFNIFVATNNKEKIVEKEQVMMGRTLEKSSARRSNVFMFHFSPRHRVKPAL